ncbi:hypothetical protein V6N13_114149 [Hibiscus sabdariffa]
MVSRRWGVHKRVDGVTTSKAGTSKITHGSRFSALERDVNEVIHVQDIEAELGPPSNDSLAQQRVVDSILKSVIENPQCAMEIPEKLSTMVKTAMSAQKHVTVIPLIGGDDRNIGNASDATGLSSTKLSHSVVSGGLVDAIVAVECGVIDS